jgi:hypothetical protein
MTASAVFILDVKGKVIISRNYRGDVPMNCVERFSGHVLEAEEGDERPVWLEHGTTYVYVKYNNLYIMAVTQRNSNAAMILLFLYKLVEVGLPPDSLCGHDTGGRGGALARSCWGERCRSPLTRAGGGCVCRSSRTTSRSWRRSRSGTTL